MEPFLAKEIDCRIIEANEAYGFHPLLCNPEGNVKIWQVSPIHGRTYVVVRHENGRSIVSKGNG